MNDPRDGETTPPEAGGPPPPAEPFAYVGRELDLFERAHNWKRYWSTRVAPSIRGDVLEVGAGNGNNLRVLHALGRHSTWTCLEPDEQLVAELVARLRQWGLDDDVRVETGTLATLSADLLYDTLLYVDVLEHIEDDAGEMAAAAQRLRPGGRLVVLAPAHQALFSPFDASVGHFRRYSVASLTALAPAGTRLVEAYYLDVVGLAASLANKLMLRRSLPTHGQIRVWDRGMVTLSRRLDPLLGRRLGKSVLAVWEAEA